MFAERRRKKSNKPVAEPRVMVVSSIPPDKGAGPQWSDLAKIACGTQRAYCAKWGYDFHLDVSDIWDNVGSPWVDHKSNGDRAPIRHINKFLLLQHFLTPEKCRREYDWVVWLDADLVIGDYETPLTKWFGQGRASNECGDVQLGDVIIPFDVNGLHPTVIMMRSTRLTRALCWAGTEAGKRMFMQHDWSENMALRFFFATPPYNGLVWYHSAKILCAMPQGALHGLPPDVYDEYVYEEGVSFALHLSALPIAKRIELANAFVKEHPLL